MHNLEDFGKPPNGIKISKNRGVLVLTYRWFTASSLLRMALAALFLFIAIILGPLHFSLALLLSPLLFPAYLLFAVYILALFYAGCCEAINITRITVTKRDLIVDQRPLPWRGNRKIRRGNVRQLYASEQHASTLVSGKTTYPLHLITQDGVNMKLADSVRTKKQATYMEFVIEEYLGLDNERIEIEI